MGILSDYLADTIRDVVLTGYSYTPPTFVYLALFTTATTKAGGGTEVGGGSYARQAIAFNTPSTGLGTQNADVTFTAMPSCTVTHFALFDDPTSGNMLLLGQLPAPRTVAPGSALTFVAGDFRVLFS